MRIHTWFLLIACTFVQNVGPGQPNLMPDTNTNPNRNPNPSRNLLGDSMSAGAVMGLRRMSWCRFEKQPQGLIHFRRNSLYGVFILNLWH